jgi:type III pantothenate kinase
VTGHSTQNPNPWLALVIGNTRLHWAMFHGERLQDTWHTQHFAPQQVEPLLTNLGSHQSWTAFGGGPQPLPECLQQPPLYVASVVPQQTQLWQDYPHLHTVTLRHISLRNLYPTLGIDRALNLVAAGERYGWPVLVVDGGTALTFTAGDDQTLIGGAILPGMGSQFQTLSQQTAELPEVQFTDNQLPRWATNTVDAIRSGVFWGLRAAVLDALMAWWQDYPNGQVVITGGDGPRIYESLRNQPAAAKLYYDPNLVFWGIRRYRQKCLRL